MHVWQKKGYIEEKVVKSKRSDLFSAQDMFPHTSVAYARHSTRRLHVIRRFFYFLQHPFLMREIMPHVTPHWGRLPLLKGFLRRTLFTYFCGGMTLEEVFLVARRLHKEGLSCIIDYAAEDGRKEAMAEQHCAAFCEVIRQSFLPFVAIKISAIGSVPLMARAQQGRVLTPAEQENLHRLHERFAKLCALAKEKQISLLIDAEYWSCQTFIDTELVMPQMRRHNTGFPLIYNTYQLYRHDAYARFVADDKILRAQGCFMGAKLVRGAYMEWERKKAKQQRRPSPIHATKAACDADYHRAIGYAMRHYEHIGTVVGSHSEQSAHWLLHQVKKNAIPAFHTHVYASQLFGMSESVSYGLSQAGIRVAKCIPYGPIEKLLPYLHRRAIENSVLSAQSRRELKAIDEELLRRKSVSLQGRKKR